jgi:chemotaxis protein CheD
MRRREDIGVLRDVPAQRLNLLAGQLWFGHRVREVHTLLGSCVAITLWHRGRGLGGMCHFLLPSRRRGDDEPRDARFGEEAGEMLLDAIRAAGARPEDFEAHLYGGADTLSSVTGNRFNVGERNIELGWTLVDRLGVQLAQIDVGDQCPRSVSLRLADGAVHMRRGAVPRKVRP